MRYAMEFDFFQIKREGSKQFFGSSNKNFHKDSFSVFYNLTFAWGQKNHQVDLLRRYTPHCWKSSFPRLLLFPDAVEKDFERLTKALVFIIMGIIITYFMNNGKL